MIRSWLLYLGALIAATVFHAYYFGWFSWFIMLLTLCLPLFSLLVSLPAMVKVHLHLQAPATCSRGTPFYVSLRGSNGFLPVPRCRFRLTVTSLMTGKTEYLPQNLPGRKTWSVTLDTDHCGVLRCGADRCRVYDYLSLFRLPISTPAPITVSVLPVPAQPNPLPNLSQSLIRRKRPKPGGGFSEEHEMRDYRPGDSLRDIHWKLSVKTDRVIVREAQEIIRGLTLLTFDLRGSRAQIDSTLEQLMWMSQWLLKHQVPHQVTWLDPTDHRFCNTDVQTEEDLTGLRDQLLTTRLQGYVPSLAGQSFPAATWHYHIEPKREDAS